MSTEISQENFRALVADWLKILESYGFSIQPMPSPDPYRIERAVWWSLGDRFGKVTPDFEALPDPQKAGLSEKQLYDIILKFAVAASRRGVSRAGAQEKLQAILGCLGYLVLEMGYEVMVSFSASLEKLPCHKAFEELAKLDGWSEEEITEARQRAKREFPDFYEECP